MKSFGYYLQKYTQSTEGPKPSTSTSTPDLLHLEDEAIVKAPPPIPLRNPRRLIVRRQMEVKAATISTPPSRPPRHNTDFQSLFQSDACSSSDYDSLFSAGYYSFGEKPSPERIQSDYLGSPSIYPTNFRSSRSESRHMDSDTSSITLLDHPEPTTFSHTPLRRSHSSASCTRPPLTHTPKSASY